MKVQEEFIQVAIWLFEFWVDACSNYHATGAVRRIDALSSLISVAKVSVFSVLVCFVFAKWRL